MMPMKMILLIAIASTRIRTDRKRVSVNAKL